MKKRDPLLDPQPAWKRNQAELVAWLRRSRDRRQRALKNLKTAGRRALTLAISLVGATLVSYGAWMIYAPAGYLVAGGLLWVIQWNYGDEGSDG
jgi:hypothetical protein